MSKKAIQKIQKTERFLSERKGFYSQKGNVGFATNCGFFKILHVYS